MLTRLLSAFLLAVLIGHTAHASIIIVTSPSGTGDNVQFNSQPKDQTGNPVFGNINNAASTLVLLTGKETLITPSGGQARVEALDGTLNFLDISLAAAGTGFESATFNLNAESGTGTATVTGFDQFGGSSFLTFALGPGENFVTLTTDELQFLTHVTISTTLGLDDVRQIRLGDVAAVPGPVAGSGLAALGAALASLVMLARRRRRHA
jgi:hypothetical protein